MKVEVAYATPQKQLILSVQVSSGSTVHDTIVTSGILSQFPEIDLSSVKVGIFSRLVSMDAVVREKDRIEIYRPLLADPKEVRRQRAQEGKTMRRGN